MDLALELDLRRGRRIGLEDALRQAIVAGRLPAGTRLPSSRVLAEELGLGRATVVAAFEQLAIEGYLVAAPGSGTRVASIPALGGHADLAAPERRVLHTDLLPGEPDLGSFPRAQWASTIRRVLTTSGDDLFSYDDPRGRRELRVALAAYVSRARGVHAHPDRIVVVPGYSSAIPLLADAFCALGITRVAVEDPCLPPHARALAAAGQELVPIPVDDGGLRVQDLGDEGAVLCTPTHQYPIGVALAPDRRGALVTWARETGGWVVEDDYDGEFRFDRHPVGALQGLDPSRVIYAGTASKSLAPGLGLAWLVLPPALVEPVVQARRRRRAAVSTIEQAALADFIDTGRLDRHVRRMRSAYRRRRDALLSILVPRYEVIGIAAGLHVTVVTERERELVERATSRSIALLGIGDHVVAEQTRSGLVVGYSRAPAHAFAAALERLAAVVEDA
ncbi:MAG TPA: PLP-dependent aminotransferase family protein [Acidimicrobiales bacterium]|nr:PLP-dependent aminotransferase family protein [Acidimicrobiales bacterium]